MGPVYSGSFPVGFLVGSYLKNTWGQCFKVFALGLASWRRISDSGLRAEVCCQPLGAEWEGMWWGTHVWSLISGCTWAWLYVVPLFWRPSVFIPEKHHDFCWMRTRLEGARIQGSICICIFTTFFVCEGGGAVLRGLWAPSSPTQGSDPAVSVPGPDRWTPRGFPPLVFGTPLPPSLVQVLFSWSTEVSGGFSAWMFEGVAVHFLVSQRFPLLG